MANTVVGFTINIDGIQSINQLNSEIKATKDAMNALDLSTEEGNKEFQKLSGTLGNMVAQQKALKKAQDDVNKSFLPEKAVGVYDQLSAKLNKLRKEFKNAALDGSKTTKEIDEMQKEIQQLDRTLKKVDGQVGQFQRNVGNYPKTFALVNRSLQRSIPGFEAFSSVLRDGEGKISGFGKALIGGFVAFQAVKVIGQAMQRLDEFISKINETKEVVAGFSGASGDDLDKLTASTTALADTFDTDAKTISEAAQALSKQLGIGFEDALLKLEGALVEGQGNADDYLKNITQIPSAFQEASGAVTEFSERNRNLLDTNKELAQSQVDVAKRLQGVNDAFKNAGKALETGLFLAFAKLIDVFRPVGEAFSRLGETLSGLFNIFNKGGEQTSLFGLILERLAAPFKILAFLLQLAADGISFFVKGITDFINSSPLLQSIFSAIGEGIGRVQQAFSNLPATFAGVVAALKQLGTNFVNFFKTLYVDAQIFGKQVQQVFGADVKNAIEDLRRQRESFNSEQSSLSDAFNKAYEKSVNESNQRRESSAKTAAKNINKVDVEAQKSAIKAAQDAQKAKQKAADDAEKKLDSDRKKFQQKEIQQATVRAALLADLSSKIIDQQIKNIQDGFQKELAVINNNFEKQKADLEKQSKDLLLQIKEREDEAAKLYGISSEEFKKVQQANTALLAEISVLQKQILTEAETEKNNAIRKLNQSENEKQISQLKDFRDKILNEELAYINDVGEFKQLKNQEQLNKALAQETDAKKREQLMKLAAEQETIDSIANIRNQIQALNDAEAQLLDENGKLKVGITQAEYDEILLARQKLFTDLSEEERRQTEDVKKNADEQAKIKQKQFEQIADNFKQGLDILSQFFDAANERQQAIFDADIEQSQLRQESLQAELENSTGLRRRFYEQRLSDEVANQAAIEKAKEEASKRDAKRQKAIAIIQATINGALAITNILATTPKADFGIASAILIGLAAATTAAQIAVIAAQPLAKGGVVGMGDEIVQFANGGRVTSGGNIKPLSNGDNVLATLKTGEIVLNKQQQGRIGYSALKAAKIPNFALGGVVGAPSGFLQDSLNRAGEEQNRFKVMQDLVIETQNRIDRLQVIYTASTEDDVEKARTERKEIKTTAQF